MENQELATAIRTGNFEAVNPLAAAYGQSVVAKLRSALTAENREAIARPALEFLNDQLHLVRVLRAHLASQLLANSATYLYQAAEPEKHCWRFEA